MRGHLCLFNHCELSPIEKSLVFWQKKNTHAYAGGRITKLRKIEIVPEGLSMCSTVTIQKYFATCRDYEQAYRNESTGKDVDKQVKVYKSHRRVFDS